MSAVSFNSQWTFTGIVLLEDGTPDESEDVVVTPFLMSQSDSTVYALPLTTTTASDGTYSVSSASNSSAFVSVSIALPNAPQLPGGGQIAAIVGANVQMTPVVAQRALRDSWTIKGKIVDTIGASIKNYGFSFSYLYRSKKTQALASDFVYGHSDSNGNFQFDINGGVRVLVGFQNLDYGCIVTGNIRALSDRCTGGLWAENVPGDVLITNNSPTGRVCTLSDAVITSIGSYA